jgi:hypothetical protein
VFAAVPGCWLRFARQQGRRALQRHQADDAAGVQRRQQQEYGAEPEGGHPVRGNAAGHAAESAGGRNAPVCRAGGCRIESLRNQRPEPRQQKGAHACEMKVDEHGNRAPPAVGVPLEEMPGRARSKAERHDRERREAGKESREERHQRQDQCRRDERHHRQGRGGPGAQEGGVAKRLRGDLVREHDARGGHRDRGQGTTVQSAGCSTSLAAGCRRRRDDRRISSSRPGWESVPEDAARARASAPSRN